MTDQTTVSGSDAGRQDEQPQGHRALSTTQAATDVLAERERQKADEGWTAEHDDAHSNGELAVAAACYAMCADARDEASILWPWDPDWWKPKDDRRNLVRAGALILAEIERLDRAATPGATT